MLNPVIGDTRPDVSGVRRGGKGCPGRGGSGHILVSTQEMPAALQSLSKISPGIAKVSSRGQNHLPPKHRFSAPQPHGAVLQTWT